MAQEASLNQYGRREPNSQENLIIMLTSAALLLLGLGAIGLLGFSILNDEAIDAAQNGDGSVILAFLDSFGLTIPILTLILGSLIAYLGFNLYTTRTVASARWSIVALTWLTIASITVGITRFFTQGQPDETLGEAGFQFGNALTAGLPFFLAVIPLAGLWYAMNPIIDFVFKGEESLGSAASRTAWNLLIPTVALLLLVAARPLEETFITSVTDKRFGAADQTVEFVGLENYQQLLDFRIDTVDCRKDDAGECETNPDGSTRWELIDRELLQEGYRTANVIGIGGESGIAISGTDDDFLNATWNTLRFSIASVTLELILGLIIALVVNANFTGRGIMRAAMLVPWAIPTVVSARLWETMFRDNQSGLFNKLFVDLGFIQSSEAWLASATYQLNALVAVDVWKTAPFMALLILAGLQTLPKDIYEAADVDGASKVRQFFTITLPLLRPTIAVALVFRTLDALRVFDVFQVLLGRSQLSMATYNYEQLIQNQAAGYASAIGVVIFILILVFTVIYVRALGVDTD